MFPVRQTNIFMSHQPVSDRQHTLHPVHNKQYKPAEIFRLKNQTPDQEQTLF